MSRHGYVYILASKKNGTLYTGVTSDLAGRMEQHETGVGSKFVSRWRQAARLVRRIRVDR
jgi:putative endonuclease